MASAAEQMASNMNFGAFSKATELKKRLWFTLFALIVYRIGTYIPIPGVDPTVLADVFAQNSGGVLGMFDVFAGGALGRMTIFALNIMPYISASIIMQLMTSIVPQMEQMKKEGEQGRKKINQYTRYGTVLLAALQGYGIAVGLEGMSMSSGQSAVGDPGMFFRLTTVITLVSGTVFLMWLGEQITERGIGNGISILIFAGIVAGLPGAIGQSFESARQGDLNILVLLGVAIVAVMVVAFVVFVERGQRRITINYAKRQQGRKVFAAQTSHLPLKLNMAGVIPAIFASSLLLFPASIGQWFGQSEGMEWLQNVSLALGPSQPLYIVLFAAGIIFFCYFYTALMFNPKDVAENLKKSGAFIPGIRPGIQTANYIDGVLGKLTLFGSLYIAAVCLMPQMLVVLADVPFYFGGTSLLIVVVVVMDFMSQVQSHLMSHQYESVMKKSNLKNFGSGGAAR